MYIESREVFESLGKVEKYFPVIDTMDLVLLSITQLKCIEALARCILFHVEHVT